MEKEKTVVENTSKEETEEVKMLTGQEISEILKESLAKTEQSDKEKLEKSMEKAKKKLEKKLEVITPINTKICELITSGELTEEDLLEREGNKIKIKNFVDIVYKHNKPNDKEDSKTEEVKEESKEYVPFGGNIVVDNDQSTVTPAFTVGYTISEDGEVEQITSSIEDASTVSVEDDSILGRIIDDPDIRKIYPSINKNDITISNGLILMKIPRKNPDGSDFDEVFRLDIIGNQVYIQAPLDAPLPNLNTGTLYNYASVPICTDIGREILTNNNYIINATTVDIPNSILREAENGA